MNCCKTYLGQFFHNADINTGLVADFDGTYIFLFEFNGTIVSVKVEDVEAGDDLIVPQGQLNESYLYNFTIQDPNGDLVLNPDDDCPNFSLKTIININSECNGNPCNDPDPNNDTPEYVDGSY